MNVINLIGAPGAGKSTLASELFAKMKWQEYNVELVSEYAKELVWEERNETMKNEVYLFAKQHHRLFRLKDKVDIIITDRPLILSEFYNQTYGDGSKEFRNLVLHETNKFNNHYFFLHRTKPYVTKGRKQTEEESYEFATKIHNMLDSLNIKYFDVLAKQNASEFILKLFNNEMNIK